MNPHRQWVVIFHLIGDTQLLELLIFDIREVLPALSAIIHHACRQRRCLVRDLMELIHAFSSLTCLRTNIEDEVLRAAVSSMRFTRPAANNKRDKTDSIAGIQVWSEPVGPSIFAARTEDTEAMQGALDRMAGPGYSQGRVVAGGG